MRPLFFAAVLILLSVPSQAGEEFSSPAVTVRGEIRAPDSPIAAWTVELIPRIGQVQRTSPAPDGSFDFDSVAPGPAELRVTSARGETLFDNRVILSQREERLSVRVTPEFRPAAPKSITVSVQQLQHKPPRKAQSEFHKGEAAMKKQHVAEAAAHFQAAVDLDAEFAEARNDLGVAYLRLNDLPRSVDQFRAVVKLAPGYQPATDNLCLLLVGTRRYVEAGETAAAILKRGIDSPAAQYAAAVSLLTQGGSRYEVLEHLKRAKDGVPTARLLTAAVLADRGRHAEAVTELEAYLRTPRGEARRPEVEAWILELNR